MRPRGPGNEDAINCIFVYGLTGYQTIKDIYVIRTITFVVANQMPV